MQDRFDDETYRNIQSDGLLDLFLGALMVVLFIFEVSEVVGGAMVFLPPVLLVLIVGAFIALRRKYTYPRVGTPGPPGRVAVRRLIAAFAVTVGLAATVGLLFVASEFAEGNRELWTGGSILVGAVVTFGLLAAIFRAPHFWAYAVIFGGPWFVWGLLDTAGVYDSPGPFLLLAVLSVFGMGAWNLARFRKQHPRPPAVTA